MKTAQDWLTKIKALPLTRRVRIMNVCGGHERTITMAGLPDMVGGGVKSRSTIE